MIIVTARVTAEYSLKKKKILILCTVSSVLHNVTKRRFA